MSKKRNTECRNPVEYYHVDDMNDAYTYYAIEHGRKDFYNEWFEYIKEYADE